MHRYQHGYGIKLYICWSKLRKEFRHKEVQNNLPRSCSIDCREEFELRHGC